MTTDVQEIRQEVLAAYGDGADRIDGPDLGAFCGAGGAVAGRAGAFGC